LAHKWPCVYYDSSRGTQLTTLMRVLHSRLIGLSFRAAAPSMQGTESVCHTDDLKNRPDRCHWPCDHITEHGRTLSVSDMQPISCHIGLNSRFRGSALPQNPMYIELKECVSVRFFALMPIHEGLHPCYTRSGKLGRGLQPGHSPFPALSWTRMCLD